MKTISIAAPCNGSGKTSLILAILRTFPQTFAVTKFTTIYREEQFCPAKDNDCACHRLSGDYLVCSDPAVLSQADTDTGRIWRAGALQTLWCVAKQEGYPQMVQEFFDNHLKPEIPLLMEGNTVLQHLHPQLRLFVVNPKLPLSWWKEDAQEQLQKADWVLLNSYAAGGEETTAEESSRVLEFTKQVQAKCLLMEAEKPLDHWHDKRIYQGIVQLLQASPAAI